MYDPCSIPWSTPLMPPSRWRRRAGAGAWASFAHLPGFSRDPRCEVVAIADPQRDLADAAAQRFGIPQVYADHQALIGRDDIDIVDVCTPSPPTSSWRGRRSKPASTCSARSRSPTTSATPAAPPRCARSKGLKTKLGFTFRYAPGDALHARAGRCRDSSASRTSSTASSRTRSGSIPKTPLRQVDHEADPIGPAGLVARRLRRADHRHRASAGRQPTYVASSARCATSCRSGWSARPAA